MRVSVDLHLGCVRVGLSLVQARGLIKVLGVCSLSSSLLGSSFRAQPTRLLPRLVHVACRYMKHGVWWCRVAHQMAGVTSVLDLKLQRLIPPVG